MTDLNDAIKLVANNAMGNKSLTEYRLGTVVTDAPLSIRISDKIVLKESKLIITHSVLKQEITVNHSTGPEKIVINPGLVPGDKVHLLRVESGQKFIVISKVV